MKSDSRPQPEIAMLKTVVRMPAHKTIQGRSGMNGPEFQKSGYGKPTSFYVLMAGCFACRRLATVHPPTNNPPAITQVKAPGSGTAVTLSVRLYCVKPENCIT